jgi:hypothetical protein
VPHELFGPLSINDSNELLHLDPNILTLAFIDLEYNTIVEGVLYYYNMCWEVGRRRLSMSVKESRKKENKVLPPMDPILSGSESVDYW